MQQEQFAAAAAGFTFSKKTRRDHACFVKHQHVAGPKHGGQIVKTAVPGAVAFEHQQAALIATLSRVLRDELGRKRVVEIARAT